MLSELDPTDNTQYQPGESEIDGKFFPEGLTFYSYSRMIQPNATFVLGRNYVRLEATAGIDDKANQGLRLRMLATVDGKSVFDKEIGKGELWPIDVDVTNAYSVTFTVIQPDSGSGKGVFAEARVVEKSI